MPSRSILPTHFRTGSAGTRHHDPSPPLLPPSYRPSCLGAKASSSSSSPPGTARCRTAQTPLPPRPARQDLRRRRRLRERGRRPAPGRSGRRRHRHRPRLSGPCRGRSFRGPPPPTDPRRRLPHGNTHPRLSRDPRVPGPHRPRSRHDPRERISVPGRIPHRPRAAGDHQPAQAGLPARRIRAAVPAGSDRGRPGLAVGRVLPEGDAGGGTSRPRGPRLLRPHRDGRPRLEGDQRGPSALRPPPSASLALTRGAARVPGGRERRSSTGAAGT